MIRKFFVPFTQGARNVVCGNKQIIMNMLQLISLLMPALVSVVSVHWIFMKVLKIAKVKGLTDNPNARKLQKTPVPVLGGIAVVFGLMMGMAACMALCGIMGTTANNEVSHMIPVLLGGMVMLYVGSLDDVLGLTAVSRLVIEVLAMLALIYGTGMCVDSLHGLWGIGEFSWWIGVPLTVFAGVGIINAYNMVDGVNGLSSGLCILCSCLLSVICWKCGDFVDAALALCFAASLIPFLLHNVFGKRSRMFIGDGGTMVMGFLVSWFVIRLLSSENASSLLSQSSDGCRLGLVAMMLAVACVPVFDTLRVMTARVYRGQSPFNPDKTHLHHVFIAVGVSHSITALCEILINAIVVLAWYLTYKCGASVNVQLYVVVLFAVACVWGMYFFLNRIVQKHPGSRLFNWAEHTHIGHTSFWLAIQRILDKGSYEDYAVILNKHLEDMSHKEKNIVLIVNFLQNKNKVLILDIMEQSGAEQHYVRSLLYELEQNGLVSVLEREPMGTPKTVRLNEKALWNNQ